MTYETAVHYFNRSLKLEKILAETLMKRRSMSKKITFQSNMKSHMT